MPRLDIFVGSRCFGCEEARRLADAVAARFQTVTVHLVDLEARPDLKPDQVVAVPAYVLDDQVLAFGNPREQDLYQQLHEAARLDQAHQ